MNEEARADALQTDLEYLSRNPQSLPPVELQNRIRQLAKQAIADADAAESGGQAREAAALYRLAARAYRRVADLASGDLRALELATALSWEERAELVEKYRERPRPVRDGDEGGSRWTPVPRSGRIESGQTDKLPKFVDVDKRKAERVERSNRKQVEEFDSQVDDRGSFRKSQGT
jgi:hypothetical protein